jgi:hypothetical protein
MRRFYAGFRVLPVKATGLAETEVVYRRPVPQAGDFLTRGELFVQPAVLT